MNEHVDYAVPEMSLVSLAVYIYTAGFTWAFFYFLPREVNVEPEELNRDKSTKCPTQSKG